MFGLFKKNPEKQLMRKHDKLMEESFQLSRTNRKLSDRKYAEAQAILQQIDQIKHAG